MINLKFKNSIIFLFMLFVMLEGCRDANIRAVTKIKAVAISGSAPLVPVEVSGFIKKHNSAAHTFKLNTITVNYSSAKLQNFPAGGIANGQSVKVKGISDNLSGSVLKARIVKLEPAKVDGITGKQCGTDESCN